LENIAVALQRHVILQIYFAAVSSKSVKIFFFVYTPVYPNNVQCPFHLYFQSVNFAAYINKPDYNYFRFVPRVRFLYSKEYMAIPVFNIFRNPEINSSRNGMLIQLYIMFPDLLP